MFGECKPWLDAVAKEPVASGSTVLVTGGAGFIGSAFLNLLVEARPDIRFVNFDALTYAGNLQSLSAIEDRANYCFVQGDITDAAAVESVFSEHLPNVVVHFAAESHVDRSILDPGAFVRTNVMGTYTMLEAARRHWKDTDGKVFHHVSTDEVFGSLGPSGYFTETTPYDPSSAYSASKAGSDHLVRAYHRTFGLPVKMTNCSNNYGPLQFPEKLIPLMTLNAIDGKPLPVYGKGDNVRDWLYVLDHVEAIWAVVSRGKAGETYNVGGNSERTNLQVVKAICDCVAANLNKPDLSGLITYVADRPGHDMRYAIDSSKLQTELGWKPRVVFEEGLGQTVHWYLTHGDWVSAVKSGSYREWIVRNYSGR